MSRHRGYRLVCIVLVALVLVRSAPLANSKPYPQASLTAVDAAAGFGARAKAVITHNACEREADYTRLRGELASGIFDNQGEDLTTILIAKAAHVRWFPNESCIRNVAPVALRRRMIDQLNDAIGGMRKTKALGSSGIPCPGSPTGFLEFEESNGEFDVNVRDLVRLLYLAGPSGGDPSLLTPATIDHMYANLLATSGKPSDETYSVFEACMEPARDELGTPEDIADRHAWYNDLANAIGDVFEWLAKAVFQSFIFSTVTPVAIPILPFLAAAGVDVTDQTGLVPLTDGRVPETENHRLMIESSRYLVNAAMIARLTAKGYARVDDIRDDQEEVREWLLRRMQQIAAHDFVEYNSRPYTRYSVNAILNLHDFAGVHGDPAVATAARIVLDLSEAKFAAMSNRGRRTSPFRRRAENDGYDRAHAGPAALYNIVGGGDHEVVRAMILANQTQLLPDRRPPAEAMPTMVYAATSTYRLPDPVLSAAVDRRSFVQTVVHDGVERVFQAPAFTVSAGGRRAPPTATVLGLADDIDRGVAMPTTIMPTVAGLTIADLFRFDGMGIGHERSANTCVADGFACGLQPQMSALFSACMQQTIASDRGEFYFVASTECRDEFPDFFLAARFVACTGTFCEKGFRWGVMDIMDAPPVPGEFGKRPGPAYVRFQAERRAALAAIVPDANGRASYTTSAGQRIEFSLAAAEPTIVSIDGAPPPAWVTAGGVFDADGQGRATIKGPGGPIVIDFSDWANPRRTP